MKDGFPTLLATIGVALIGMSALSAETPASAPTQTDPPVQDLCKRRVILAECLRSNPTKVPECEREAERQSWLPTSQVHPVCRGVI